MKLRSQLYLMVFGALVPTAVFTVAAGRLLVQHEREIVQRVALGHAHPAMGVVDAQRVPEDAVLPLVDREKRVIVRIPADPAGVPAPDHLREAIDRAPEDWFHNRTPEGRSTYTSYVTSRLSGWVLGIEMPSD